MFAPDPTPLEQDLFRQLQTYVPPGVEVQIPPQVAGVLPLRFAAYEPDKHLVIRAEAANRYANPMGVYQGGILTAVIDVGFGTLAMLAAKAPCVSVTIETTFLRPMMADGQDFEVHVGVRAKTRTMVFLEAEARDANQRLIAASSSAMSIHRGN